MLLLNHEHGTMLLREGFEFEVLVICVYFGISSHLIVDEQPLLREIPSEEYEAEMLRWNCVVDIEQTVGGVVRIPVVTQHCRIVSGVDVISNHGVST